MLHRIFQWKHLGMTISSWEVFFFLLFLPKSPQYIVVYFSCGSFELWHVWCHLSVTWWAVPCLRPGAEAAKPWATEAEPVNLITRPGAGPLGLLFSVWGDFNYWSGFSFPIDSISISYSFLQIYSFQLCFQIFDKKLLLLLVPYLFDWINSATGLSILLVLWNHFFLRSSSSLYLLSISLISLIIYFL